jgi:hypothetical protein
MIFSIPLGFSGGVTPFPTREGPSITRRQAPTPHDGDFHRDPLVSLKPLLLAETAEGRFLVDTLETCG